VSTTDPKQIVRRYYDEVFTGRSLAALDEVVAPNFICHSASHGDFAIDDMRRTIAQEYADFPDDETIVDEQFQDGDRVITRWRYRWKHDHPLFGEQPTGQWLTMEGLHIDRVVGGRIAERWEIKDFWGVVQRLGGKLTFPRDGEG
jgi:predicted ester cyclase